MEVRAGRQEKALPVATVARQLYIFSLRFVFIYVLYVCLCGYMHLSAGSCRGQKRASDPLELE